MKIIDLSHWNKITDWKKVKNNCDGVILKVGGSDYNRVYIDPNFLINYKNAKNNGIKIGVYWFTGRTSSQLAKYDAEYLYNFLSTNKIKCELPLFLDIEMKKHTKLSSKTVQNIITTFCAYLESKKMFAGFYTFASFYNDKCGSLGNRFYLWLANWNNDPNHYKPVNKIVQAHQYTCKGSVPGITGDVDISIFNDVDKVIKKAGLNK